MLLLLPPLTTTLLKAYSWKFFYLLHHICLSKKITRHTKRLKKTKQNNLKRQSKHQQFKTTMINMLGFLLDEIDIIKEQMGSV